MESKFATAHLVWKPHRDVWAHSTRTELRIHGNLPVMMQRRATPGCMGAFNAHRTDDTREHTGNDAEKHTLSCKVLSCLWENLPVVMKNAMQGLS
jgi:hypothetical protein